LDYFNGAVLIQLYLDHDYSGPKQLDLRRGVIIHEILHIYDYRKNLSIGNEQFISILKNNKIEFDVQGEKGAYQLTDETVKRLEQMYLGINGAYSCSDPFVYEFFVCGGVIYMFFPEHLKQDFPDLYEYYKNNVFAGREYPPATQTPTQTPTQTQIPGLSPGTEEPTQPPTVLITPENVDRLRTFPRPPGDNGRGFHFSLDMKEETVASDIQKAKDLGVKWAVLYPGDELQAIRAATQVWQAGIMPIIRFNAKIDKAGSNFQSQVRKTVEELNKRGVPVYLQIYNEPGDSREWSGGVPNNYAKIFAQNWRTMAEVVYNSGGYPGLQILNKDELEAVLKAVPPDNPLWQKTWFSLHNYGNFGDISNPPDYVPASEDETAFLNFLKWAEIFKDKLGFVPPIIGTEGGWEPKPLQGQSKPTEERLKTNAQYFKQVYDSFRTGVLPNGEPLPDYFFAFSPYLLSGYSGYKGFAWYGGLYGDLIDNINAVKSIPDFERKFSWDIMTVPAGKTPTVTPGTPTRPQTPVVPQAIPNGIGGTGVFQYQEIDLKPIENIQKVNLELCKQNPVNCSLPFNIWFRMNQLTQKDQETFLDDRFSKIMNYCDNQRNCVNSVPIIEIHD